MIRVVNKYFDLSSIDRFTVGETNVESFPIYADRYMENGFDLSTLNWFLRGVNETYDVQTAEDAVDVSITENEIIFTLYITDALTAVPKHIDVLLVGKDQQANEIAIFRSSGLHIRENPAASHAPPDNVIEKALAQMTQLQGDVKDSANLAMDSANDARASANAAASSAAESAEHADGAADSAAAAAASAGAAKQSETAAAGYAEQAQQVSQGAVGYYETGAALRAAHPTAEAGNWAIVGDTDTIWVWDTDGPGWLDSGQNVNLTDYYTKAQTDAKITAGSVASAAKLTTARSISIGGTSKSFNGTANITWTQAEIGVTAAKSVAYTIAVPLSNWVGSAAPYTNTVTVPSITANTVLSDIQLVPAQVGDATRERANSLWTYLDTQDGKVVFTAAGAKPASSFSIIAREVK